MSVALAFPFGVCDCIYVCVCVCVCGHAVIAEQTSDMFLFGWGVLQRVCVCGCAHRPLSTYVLTLKCGKDGVIYEHPHSIVNMWDIYK